jgi:prepilin signal peptidase PulO-like enzyme (type II secretory pathway)
VSSQVLLVPAWALIGAGLGVGVRWASVRLARLEGLEPGFRPWMIYGPVILNALLFAVFAYRFGPQPLLLLMSAWVAVLVHIIFFDLEHRLILDRVLFPAMALALAASLLHHPAQPWWLNIAFGAGAGLVFLLAALAGSFILRADALGFGDVKLAAFIGLVAGLQTPAAVFVGVFLAAAAAIAMMVLRLKSLKDTFAYGPYLAAGTLYALFLTGGR